MIVKCQSSHKQHKLKTKEEPKKRYCIKSLKTLSFKDLLGMASRKMISSKNYLEEGKKTPHLKASNWRKISMMMISFRSSKLIEWMKLLKS